jgi:hypothetical protein
MLQVEMSTMPATQRTTISLRPDLHKRIRIWCIEENVKFTDAVCAALDQAFPAAQSDVTKKKHDRATA